MLSGQFPAPHCSPALGPHFSSQLALPMSLPSLPHAPSCLSQLNQSQRPAAPPHQIPVPHPSHTQALRPTNRALYNSKAIPCPCPLMFTPSVINAIFSPIALSIIKHWKAEHWIRASSLGLPATGKEGLEEKASVGAREWQTPPCSAPAPQPQPQLHGFDSPCCMSYTTLSFSVGKKEV